MKNKTKQINQKVNQLDFDLDEWVPDKERIKRNTLKYAEMPISEAFAAEYKLKVKKQVNELEAVNTKVGSFISVTLAECTKRNTLFKHPSIGQQIKSNQSLYGSKLSSTDEVKVKIVSVTDNEIVVDPVIYYYNEWFERVSNENYKNSLLTENIAKAIICVEDLHLIKGGFTGKVYIAEASEALKIPVSINCFVPGSQIVLNIEKDFNKWEGKSIETYYFNTVYNSKTDANIIVCSRKLYMQHIGDINKICIYQAKDKKDNTMPQYYNGVVTGKYNGRSKVGMFVEIGDLSVTGFMPIPAKDHWKYNVGDVMPVEIEELEVSEDTAFEVEDNILKNINIRVILSPKVKL